MTISTTSNSISYTGDGATLAFAYPYQFIATADIKVYLNGVLQLAGYSVAGILPIGGSGAFQSGTVTFVAAPLIGVTVKLQNEPDLLQSTAIPSNDPFPAKTVERMADKLTLLVQRAFGKLANALVFPDGETTSGVLPDKATRASKVLTFDPSGVPTASTPASGTAADVLIQLALSTGATLVGWIQSGVGAVLRTIRDKLRDTVSVKDFGAVGDGVTNDTAALQAALDRIALVGGELVFPGGVYNYTTLTLTTSAANAIRLRGVGSMNRTNFTQGAVLVCTAASGQAFTLDGAAVAANVIFDGLVFKGNPNMDAGLVLYRAASVVLRNVVLQGWSKATAPALWSKKGASASDFTGNLTLDNCVLSGNTYGWYTDSITGNVICFKRTSFLDNTRGILVGTTAIQLQSQQISTDAGCTFEGNVIDIECFGGIQGLNINGGYFENTNAAHQDARIRIVENAFSGRNKAINIVGALFSRTIGSAGASIVSVESADLIRIKSCFTINGGATDRYFVDVSTGTSTLIDIDKPSSPSGVTPYPVHAASGNFAAFKSADRHGLETLSKPYSLAKVSAGVANVTGDGTVYTVLFNTEVFDNAGNYDPTTGIFNVPATGVYRITARVALEQVAAAGGFTGGFLNLVASGSGTHTLDYTGSASQLAANEQMTLQGSIDVKATVGDTFRINLQVSGGTKTIDIVNTSDTNQLSVAML